MPTTISTNTADPATSLNTLKNGSYQQITPPPFIPANFGAAGKSSEALVLHLLSIMNAQGRTVVSIYDTGILCTLSHSALERLEEDHRCRWARDTTRSATSCRSVHSRMQFAFVEWIVSYVY